MGLIVCVENTKWSLRFLPFYIFVEKEFHTMLHGIDGNNVISDFSTQIDTNRQFQCGCNSMVECGVSIPIMGVQFSSSAPIFQVASIIVMVEWLICNQLVPVRPGVEAPVYFYVPMS